MNLYKTSSAVIKKSAENSIIRVIEYLNPEKTWPALLREFFLELDYGNLYSNFSTLRIGAVHPFALLLFQDVSGSKMDLSVFPSITITDTSENEVLDTLGRGFQNVVFTGAEMALIKAGKESGQFIISDENMDRLNEAVNTAGKIVGRKQSIISSHNVDMTIWCDNKDLTSVIYDALRQFFMGNISKLHNMGFDIQSPITGRRSGDINVEFGKLLYGATVSVQAHISTSCMEFDVSTGVITNIVNVADYTNP